MPWKNTLARVYSLLRNQPEGYLDSVDQNAAKGWVFDHADPSRPVEVELLVDGESTGTYTANSFRADLAQSGCGDGYHGFEIPLPASALDGGSHQVSIRTVSGATLRGSPRTVTSAGAPGIGFALDRPDHVRGTYHPGLPPPEFELIADSRAAEAAAQPLSVVIPTYNRGALMEDNVRAAVTIARGLDIEFLLIDDGSTDHTPRRLSALAREFPNVRWERLSNGGPGRARNTGVAMAKNELVLFLGDDTRPASQDFFIHHIRAHHWLPKPEIAVLGKIVWPNQPNEHVNFVMSHIQGTGQEQFGYFSLMPYTWLDWRFFYTANVSFKKSLAGEWPADGFSSEFPLASYEDGEFAYDSAAIAETPPRTSSKSGDLAAGVSAAIRIKSPAHAGSIGRVWSRRRHSSCIAPAPSNQNRSLMAAAARCFHSGSVIRAAADGNEASRAVSLATKFSSAAWFSFRKAGSSVQPSRASILSRK